MNKPKPESSAIGKVDWGRLLLWTPLLVGGVVASVLATRAMRLRRAVRKMRAQPADSAEAREMLRRAVVGNDKETIVAVLGPPRAAAHRGAAAGAHAAGAADAADQFRAADTWYYPYDHAHRSAIVIEFAGGVARRAQFIESPAAEEKR